MKAIHAGHPGCRDLSAESQDVVGIGAELHVVPADPALQFAMLMGAVEGSGDDVAHLRELDLFERASGLVCVVGVDGPVAREVGWRGWRRRGSGCGRVGRRWSKRAVRMAIRNGGGSADLIVGLSEEVFGSAGMASQLVVVGPLCGADEIECLDDGLLGRGEIAVSLGINGGDRCLGRCQGRHDGCAREQGQELDWKFHLRSTLKWIMRSPRSCRLRRQQLLGGLGLDLHA
jgi:hypothetical protein